MDELETWFEEVDTDGSGDIDMEEMREALVARLGGWVDRTAVEDLLARADTDGNGAIDYDEFTKILLAERTTRFAPVSGGGGFLGVSPA